MDREANNEEVLADLCNRFNRAAEQAIPQLAIRKFYPRPFWTERLKQTRETQEKLYKKYRRKLLQNFTLWKRAKANNKKALKKKRKSWIEFASKFNYKTPTMVIYENVRKLKGTQCRKIIPLKEHDQYYTTNEEIENKVGKTFSGIANPRNYTPAFRKIKEQQEKIPVKFIPDGEHEYNRNCTRIEMDMALRKSKNTAPGPDNICYQMIREFPNNVKHYLLEIYNKFWNEAYFLDECRSATVIAFPKPDNDHSKADNYRPITGVVGCIVIPLFVYLLE